MVQKKDLVLITDNSLDKIIITGVAQIILSGADTTRTGLVAHGLSAIPFFNAEYSTNGGITWYPADYGDNLSYGPLAWVLGEVWVDAINVNFRGTIPSAVGKTFNFRYELFLKEI